MRRLFYCAGLLFLLAGCTREIAIDSAPALGINTRYATKVPGRWLVIADGVPLTRDLALGDQVCGQIDYPLNFDRAFTQSVVDTFRPLVDEARAGDGRQNPQAYTGVIRVHATGFRLSTRDADLGAGFSFGTTVEIDMRIVVEDRRGRILDSETTGSGTSEGNAGLLCDRAAPIFANAARFAITSGLADLATKFAGSEAVHEADDVAARR